jgi:hypothetical protein
MSLSYYELTCECGASIKATLASGSCATCKRRFEIQWGEQDPGRLASMAATLKEFHGENKR